ncbi:MAG: DUF4136 domain-containing protein [Bacteroidota bacterium]
MRLKYSIFAAAAALLLACNGFPDLELRVKSMVVQTSFAKNINFSAYSTFFIPTDTLGLVSNVSDDTIIVGDYAKGVTARVRAKVSGGGYTYVERDQDPDIAVNVYIVDNSGVFQSVTYPNYLNGYPGYFYSGYYGFGGYYNYPVVQTYSYQSGILAIELIDLKNRTPDNKLQVVWVANIGDVYTSTDPFVKVLDAIDQAFRQSPYLKRS